MLCAFSVERASSLVPEQAILARGAGEACGSHMGAINQEPQVAAM